MDGQTVTEMVAHRVRQLRTKRGWSAQRLADECARAGLGSLTRGTIAKIESGVRKSVTADELSALARVLGVTPTELLSPEPGGAAGQWIHAAIVAVGVDGSGPAERGLLMRRGLFAVLENAFEEADVPWDGSHREDRGDGVLVLVPSDVPKSRLVDQLPHRLLAGLRRHNAVAAPEWLRVRVAVHAGEVNVDGHGAGGDAVVMTYRLLDAPVLRSALRQAPGTLAIIASAWFYEEVIRHDPAALAESYRPVDVTTKGTATRAWVRLPDQAMHAPPRDTAVPHDAVLVMQLQNHPDDEERYLVRTWRQLGPDWSPRPGDKFEGTLAEIQARVAAWVTEAEAGWATEADSIRLEFVLPRNLINLPVDQWHRGADAGLPQPLGLRYPVVVRSLDRMRQRDWHRDWRRRWRAASSAEHSTLWTEGEDEPRKLLTQLAADGAVVSLVLVGPPPDANPVGPDPVSVALMSGVPVLVWHRGEQSAEFAAGIRDILAGGVDQLPEKLRILRGQAFSAADPDAHIGSKISLLWDDPDRIVLPEAPSTSDEAVRSKSGC